MATNNILRIVSKDNSSQQAFLNLNSSTLPSLKPSSVRIKTQLIGLSSTSIAYCALGDQIGWWNTFPVSEQAPVEYHDGRWGVAPAWGYAVVVESTIDSLKNGTWLWGYMPTATCSFDLELKQSDAVHEHRQEVSERRAKLEPIYNLYIIVESGSVASISDFAKFTVSLKATFESGYLLNQWVFAPRGRQPIHPVPESGSDWSVTDSDLTSTLIICLAAGSRTGRAFVHQLAETRPAGEQPAAVIEVTESSESILHGNEPPFTHQLVSYDHLQSPQLTSVLRSTKFNRVVIVDFGGRGTALSVIVEQLQTHVPDVDRVIIALGVEQNLQTPTELGGKLGSMMQQGAIVFGTSSLNDAAIKQIGEAKYYQQMNKAFTDMIDTELARDKGSASASKVLGIGLDERHGVRGDNGLEGAWNDLYSGRAVGSRALVVDLRNSMEK